VNSVKLALATALLTASFFAATGSAAPFPGRFLVLISASTGAVDRGFPDADGFVDASVPDGRGGWFVGGLFRHIGSVQRQGIAHLRADGSLDTTWNARLPNIPNVLALARVGTRLYAGGPFGLVALDARTGATLDFRTPRFVLAPGGGSRVNAVAVGAGRVYVAGGFERIGAQRRWTTAAFDARTGALTSWAPTIQKGEATTVAVGNGRVYLGGVFYYVDGRPRLNLAAVTPRTGTLTSWAPKITASEVDSILVAGRAVLAGPRGFGAFDAATARQLPWSRQVHYAAGSFAEAGGVAYLGGDIRDPLVSVGAMSRHNLAAVNLRTGRFTSWAPNVAKYTAAMTLSVSGRTMLAGGAFTRTLG
jgi:hypothetical protein